MHPPERVVIIGAGPAGLTAALQLQKAGLDFLVLEKDSIVGGIARTANYKGYRFDIGGHRFFTKVTSVEKLWQEILPEGEFLTRSRLSRILYNDRFFDYPLRPANALLGLGILNTLACVFSYSKARLFPKKPELTFEDWVANRFGRRLFEMFFKTYTEKVWGIPCHEITADWAAQRIKGLSLFTAVKNALFGKQPGDKKKVIKTLIGSFSYPRLGPGMMWERVVQILEQKGQPHVELNCSVQEVSWNGSSVESVSVGSGSSRRRIEGSHFISSMPIRELFEKMVPAPPGPVLEAARSLNYRDFLTVALIIDQPEVFPDTWIYIHDPKVQVGRIQNFKNWSPDMVPDASKTCLGLEYFCFEGNDLWNTSDEDLVALASRELDSLGLVPASCVLDGTVVRMPKAYPVYDGTYQRALKVIRGFLKGLDNLQLVGRNGMHKYNNQDHSMLTAMMAVENLLGAEHDLWQVNVDEDYHEEVTQDEPERTRDARLLASTQPRVPERRDS